MSWVTIAITVGSTLVNAEQQHQVADKQDNQLAAQIRQQMGTQQKVAGKTAQLVNAAKGATNDQPQADAAKQQYDTAVKANAATAAQPYQVTGDTSKAYADATKNAALGVSNYTNTKSGLMADMAAPGLARQNAQTGIDNYKIDTGQLNQNQSLDNYVNQIKLQGIHASPWLSLLSGAGAAYAKARSGSMASTADPGALDDSNAYGLADATGSN